MKKSVLYIINFYGSPPLNYFEKFLKETRFAHLTILKLPSVRTSKYRLHIEAFIKDEKGTKHDFKLSLFMPLPYVAIFLLQYVINSFLVFFLLRRVERKHFDIGIGETNFGSAVCVLLKTIGRVKKTVYFNGDILPDPSSSKKCFFLPNSHRFQFLYKVLDTMLLQIQLLLRRIGYKNNLVWYANDLVKKWDNRSGIKTDSYIIIDPILIDFAEYAKYGQIPKNKNEICYIGRIDEYVGLDVVIHSLPRIRKKIPKIVLHIIGGSEIIVEKYKKLVQRIGLTDSVRFYGFMPSMTEAYSIMSRCSLGLALYKPSRDNVSMFAQPSKPKEYIKLGLPVLVTENGPAVGEEIVKWHAGVSSQYEAASVAKAIIETLTDDKVYHALRKGVKKYARKNHYFDTFSRLWDKILIQLDT